MIDKGTYRRVYSTGYQHGKADEMARAKRGEVLVGTVGIDAGMLMLGDPCYVIDKPLGAMDWNEFLDALYKQSAAGVDASWWTMMGALPNGEPFRAGVVVTTGWGDGEYPVTAVLNKEGRVKSVTVTFIPGDE